MRLYRCLPATCLVLGSFAQAGGGFTDPADTAGGDRWQRTDAGMDRREYRASVDHNRRLLLGALDWRPAGSGGDGGEANIALHDDDSPLGFVIRDSLHSRRALLLQFRKDW